MELSSRFLPDLQSGGFGIDITDSQDTARCCFRKINRAMVRSFIEEDWLFWRRETAWCGVPSCLESEGILSGVKSSLQTYGDIASNAVAGALRARCPATLAGLKLRDAQPAVHSTARRAITPICAFNLSPDGVHRAIDRAIPIFLYCHLIIFFSYVILLTIG